MGRGVAWRWDIGMEGCGHIGTCVHMSTKGVEDGLGGGIWVWKGVDTEVYVLTCQLTIALQSCIDSDSKVDHTSETVSRNNLIS